jgi:predicted alpha/beta-fold hydrolase
MPAIEGRYRAPWWLPGPHAQTIVPARVLRLARVPYRRERWETPDGDFLDADWSLPELPDAGSPMLVLFHGLEGDSQSHYARALMGECIRRGWRGLVVHFRGCSGEPNRLPRAYHSGDSDEIDWVLRQVASRWPDAPLHVVGISLGGNALAKWAGERGADAGIVRACVAVSAPFDLEAGGESLARGFNLLYTSVFLQTLRPKALAKIRLFPGIADPGRIRASRNLFDFDDAFTAPVHGFAGARDYWRRASAKPFLQGIQVPMLALNARNDPFQPGMHLPGPGQLSRQVTLEAPDTGGHVGFVHGARSGVRWYMRDRVFDFLERGQ